MSEDRNSEVGYGKPPKHTRFKPGQSATRRVASPAARTS
jgi:hypothetical protein